MSTGRFDLNRPGVGVPAKRFADLTVPTPALSPPELNHTAIGDALTSFFNVMDDLGEIIRKFAKWLNDLIVENIDLERFNHALEGIANFVLSPGAVLSDHLLPVAAVEALRGSTADPPIVTGKTNLDVVENQQARLRQSKTSQDIFEVSATTSSATEVPVERDSASSVEAIENQIKGFLVWLRHSEFVVYAENNRAYLIWTLTIGTALLLMEKLLRLLF